MADNENAADIERNSQSVNQNESDDRKFHPQADQDHVFGNAEDLESSKSFDDVSENFRLMEAEREVLRARAELENFRKRMQRDAEQQLKYANVAIVRDLVDVVDNLNRATAAAQAESSTGSALLNGVQMVSQQLAGVLSKYGCKTIESLGSEFDPNVHEAIAQTPSEEFPAGTVAQEVAVGYMLHDRVVRPSSVIVSTGPAAK